jgi:hypothetical protein
MLYQLGLNLTTLYTKFSTIYDKRNITTYLLLSETKFQNNSKIIALHEKEINKLKEEVSDGLISICQELEKWTYPYEHAQGNISLKYALVPTEIENCNKDIWTLFDSVDTIQNRFSTLLWRIYIELISVAEKVEVVLGLSLLPDLPEKNEPEENNTEEKKGIFALVREFFN